MKLKLDKAEAAPAQSGQHTPPWVIKRGGLGNCWLEDLQGNIILEFRDTTSETEKQIVAGAPALLALLAVLERIANDPHTTCNCGDIARAAIAAAKGGGQ